MILLTFSTIANADRVDDYRRKIQSEVDHQFEKQEELDVLFIEKGSAAPFSGVLFPEQKASELRRDLLESDKTKIYLESERQTSKNLLQLSQLKDSEIELYRKQNTRLQHLENTNSKMNYIWFALGIVVTGVAVYGAGGLSR